MRAVLDPNVLTSAVLSSTGAPAQVLSHWRAGAFDLVVSDRLLDELGRALRYPKLRSRITPAEAADLVRLLQAAGVVALDPPEPPRRSPDPGDDYLIALAEAERALLVSGDQHLLGLAAAFPIRSAAQFLDLLRPEPAR